MNTFQLSITLLTDALMETLPDGTDYLATRLVMCSQIHAAIQIVRDKMEGKE